MGQKDTLCCLAGWEDNFFGQILRAFKDTSWIIQRVFWRMVAVQLQPSFFQHAEQQLAPCNGEDDSDSQKKKGIGFLLENGPPLFKILLFGMLYSYPKEHSPHDACLKSIFTHQAGLRTLQYFCSTRAFLMFVFRLVSSSVFGTLGAPCNSRAMWCDTQELVLWVPISGGGVRVAAIRNWCLG